MIDKRPALIARCRGVADVISSVRFARTHDLLLAVRGGGHNLAGNAVCDGGLMIDLSPMKGVRVDPALRMASAQTGLTWESSTTRPKPSAWPSPGDTSPPPVSVALRSAADGATWRASTASPPTTFAQSISSRPTANFSPPALPSMRTSFGACGVAAGILASPPHLSINSIRSAPCWRESWLTQSPRQPRS